MGKASLWLLHPVQGFVQAVAVAHGKGRLQQHVTAAMNACSYNTAIVFRAGSCYSPWEGLQAILGLMHSVHAFFRQLRCPWEGQFSAWQQQHNLASTVLQWGLFRQLLLARRASVWPAWFWVRHTQCKALPNSRCSSCAGQVAAVS